MIGLFVVSNLVNILTCNIDICRQRQIEFFDNLRGSRVVVPVVTSAKERSCRPIKVSVAASTVHVIAASILLNGTEAFRAAENVILYGVFEQFIVT